MKGCGIRVLLIDDDPLVLSMFELILIQNGFEADVASSALEGLNCLQHKFFDVLICDIRLGELDGFDVAELARKSLPNLSVLFITGNPRPEDDCRAMKFNSVICSKPIPPSALVAATIDAFQRKNCEKRRNAGREFRKEISFKGHEIAGFGLGE